MVTNTQASSKDRATNQLPTNSTNQDIHPPFRGVCNKQKVIKSTTIIENKGER